MSLVVRFAGFVGAIVAFTVTTPALAQSFSFSNTTNNGSLSGAFPSFTINGPNGNVGGTASYSAVFSTGGSMSFSWNYHTDDCDGPSFDPAGYTLNGTSIQLSNSGGSANQTGSSTVQIPAGQTFGWYVHSTDGACGAGHVTVNASFTPDFDANAAAQAAQTFVSTRQQIVMDALNFPSIFNRGSNGVQVQVDADGMVNAMAFAASSSGGKLNAAESALTRMALGRTSYPSSSDTSTSDVNYWIDGQLGLHSSGGDTGQFAVVTMGADTTLGGRTLVGFAVEGDWVTAPTNPSNTSGLGFMAGPYASVALSDSLAVNAHLLVGHSWNGQSVIQAGGTYSGGFETGRLDAGASLAGRFTMDQITIRPDISFSLITEGTGDYALNGPNGRQTVPGFVVTTYEAIGGSDFEYRLDQGDGVVVIPKTGLRLGLDFGRGTSVFAVGSGGVAIEMDNGMTMDLGVQSRMSTDGLRTLGARAAIDGHL